MIAIKILRFLWRRLIEIFGLIPAFFRYYYQKLNENRQLKTLHYIGFFLLFVNLIVRHYFPDFINKEQNSNEWRYILKGPLKSFIEHFWIEIFSGIVIYVLLDDRIKQMSQVPEAGKRDHSRLLNEFRKCRKEIRILDTSIYSFIENPVAFEEALIDALNARDKLKIEILLLHPDTYAAEQRSKDLSKDTKEYLKKMKIGLYRLHMFKNGLSFAHQKRVHIRLFKATPMMIYVNWDGNVNFGLLHPNKIADQQDSFFVKKDGDLPNSFEDYFDILWGDQDKVVDLNDYLFVKIPAKGPFDLPEILHWGGDDESRESPRYISDLRNNESLRSLQDFSDDGDMVKILHDKITLLARIKQIGDRKNEAKYIHAKSKIRRTYGEEIPKFENAIFEIDYLYEGQITYSHKNLVKGKLKDNGYAFVSHAHYDIKISQFLKNTFDCITDFYKNDLFEDEFDRVALRFRKPESKDESYKLNPRTRCLSVYECNLTYGVIDVTPTNNQRYPYPLIIVNEGEPSYNSGERVYKTLHDLSNQSGITKKRKEQLTVIDLFIQSAIKDDLINVLGQTECIKAERKFDVYVSLIRTRVSPGKPSAYPTPQTLNQTDCDYKVVHLVKRENIIGGMDNISIEKDSELGFDDSLLLENPLDAVFFARNVEKNGKILKVEHFVNAIHFDRDSEKNIEPKEGIRDVLVIEFADKERQKNKSLRR